MSSISAGTTTGTALVSTGDTSGELVLKTNGSTTAVTIDTSQNVGIGTSSPGTKLAVSGGIAGTAGLNVSGGGWGVLPYVANSLVIDNNSGQSRFFATGADASTDGSFLFYTSQTDGGANERMRITSDGYLRMASGTGGIQFNGDTAAANALDDYEEGTWTPVFNGGTGNPTVTYTNQYGHYIKIGKSVFCSARLTINTTSGGSGGLIIRGMPFNQASLGQLFSVINIGYGSAFTTAMPTFGRWYYLTDYLELYYRNTATSETVVGVSSIGAGTDLIVNFTYISV